jgi:mannose-1-phosphate guanylyltransferase
MHSARKISSAPNRRNWALILAGGEGTRLHDLTRSIAGEVRPKQFCRFFGGKTLLRQTCDRIRPLFPRDQELFVVTRAHERFYADELNGTGNTRILVQPQSRGTGLAIAAGILRILQFQPDAIVGVFPSDHYYSNEGAFRLAINAAMGFANTYSGSIILLGAEAHSPEVEYGWIEPGQVVEDPPAAQLLRVNRFWEKPSLSQAETLLDAKCLWNTFVMIGTGRAFLDLLNARIPDVVRHLSDALAMGDWEAAYRGVRAVDFSQEVLGQRPDRLLVVRDAASGWADLGNSDRVIDTLVRNRIEADWLDDLLVARHALA